LRRQAFLPFLQSVLAAFFDQIAGRWAQLDDTTTVGRLDFDHHETKLRKIVPSDSGKGALPSCELPQVGLCDTDLHGRGLKEPPPVIAGKLSIKLFDH